MWGNPAVNFGNKTEGAGGCEKGAHGKGANRK
jgi:hypothetical protein